MRHLPPERTKKLGMRSRLVAVIAIACFVAMTGCGEPTGPRTIWRQSPPQPELTVSGLAVLAPELHDAADVFAQGVADPSLRGQAVLAVNHLADQLLAGKVVSSRAALAQLRTLLAKLSDIPAIELTPVGLALDYIERRMYEILNSN